MQRLPRHCGDAAQGLEDRTGGQGGCRNAQVGRAGGPLASWGPRTADPAGDRRPLLCFGLLMAGQIQCGLPLKGLAMPPGAHELSTLPLLFQGAARTANGPPLAGSPGDLNTSPRGSLDLGLTSFFWPAPVFYFPQSEPSPL